MISLNAKSVKRKGKGKAFRRGKEMWQEHDCLALN